MSITQDIPHNDETTAENHEFLKVSTIVVEPLQHEQKKTREKSLGDRALKRMQRREENHALAEDLGKAVRLSPPLHRPCS